jgi:hypothetical protein
MNIPSTQSGHWTDDELLAFLYGIGPSGDHLDACFECQSRLSAMQSSRQAIEHSASLADSINPSLLAAQRRAIYQRMQQPVRRWNMLLVRRCVGGLATACILGGSLFLYQHNREAELAQERINDAKLAQEVAAMAQDSDISSMAPLEGLFE